MNIFIAMRDHWDGGAEVIGVYSSFELAESAVKERRKELSRNYDYSIIHALLDAEIIGKEIEVGHSLDSKAS